MESPLRSGLPLGRRTLLRLGAALPVALAVTSCTGTEPEPPDPLEESLRAARADAALAELAGRRFPELQEQAGLVAEVRNAHGTALQREIDRLSPPDPDEPKPRRATTGHAEPTSAQGAMDALTESLISAGDEATALATRQTGYRAGLLGSIAASCASLREVLA